MIIRANCFILVLFNAITNSEIHLVSGIFFVLPCIESYSKVDLRTVSFDVPPQEVSHSTPDTYAHFDFLDFDQRFGDSVS